MTGDLLLPGMDSTNPLSATRKQYADAASENLQPHIDAKVSKSGDTMTGSLRINGSCSVSGRIHGGYDLLTADTAATGTVQFGTSGVKYLRYDGSDYTFYGGSVISNTVRILAGKSPTTGVVRFSSDPGCYLWFDSSKFVLSRLLTCNGSITAGDGYFKSPLSYAVVSANGGAVYLRGQSPDSMYGQAVFDGNEK